MAATVRFRYLRPMAMRLFVGGMLPLALVLGVILFVPASWGMMLGISYKSWALFACAPATSLLLRLSLA